MRLLPPLWLFPDVSLPKYVPRNSEDKNGNNTSRFRHSTSNKKLVYLVARKKKYRLSVQLVVTRPRLMNHILYIMKVKKNVSNSEGKHEACNVL